jgi:hypothetical protein
LFILCTYRRGERGLAYGNRWRNRASIARSLECIGLHGYSQTADAYFPVSEATTVKAVSCAQRACKVTSTCMA